MKFLIALVQFVALVSTYPSHPHLHGHGPVLVPYVLNPGGIGGIYKGPDSATILKGPDGSVIKSKQIGGAVEIDDVPPVVLPLGRPNIHVADSVEGAVLHSIPFVHEGGPVIRTHGSRGGVIHAGGASSGSIHAGPLSAGSIHTGLSSAGVIHTDGHGLGLGVGGASAGSIHAGPVSAGSILAGPSSGGLINTGRAHGHSSVEVIHSHGLGLGHDHIHTGAVSAGSIHAGPSSAGTIHVAPSSTGSIHVGPSSAGSIHAGLSSPGLIHSDGIDVVQAGPLLHTPSFATGPALFDGVTPVAPVILNKNPIIVDDLLLTGKDPKIVEEHVIVGNKVISVPKQVEEDSDLIGPSGTISTRGGDAVISGPASVTIKGGGVVSDVKKQSDVHVNAVEVKPIVTHVPIIKPVVESAGTIITQARPILPLKSIYAPNAPIHSGLHQIGPSLRTAINSGSLLTNPLPLSLSSLDLLPNYAPAYVKYPHY